MNLLPFPNVFYHLLDWSSEFKTSGGVLCLNGPHFLEKSQNHIFGKVEEIGGFGVILRGQDKGRGPEWG